MSTDPQRENGPSNVDPRNRTGPFHHLLVHFERTLGAGILVVLPIGVTAVILKFFFDLLDPLLEPVVDLFPGPSPPGLGLVALIVLIYLLGLVTTQVFGVRMINLGHRIMEFIPVVKSIYGTARTAVIMLSTSGERPYSGVVLVKFPHPGMQSIGLVTSRMIDTNGEEMLAVYIPTTPIPSSGFLVIVPSKDVTNTEMSVDEAMKVVISGGILAGQEFQQFGVLDRSKSSSNQ
ncbi:MAG: hypothetical protein BZY88_08045 [SAR202 cluster bacterium Io17-Chloro-G9]|nr:MAG: hypothetical protein BZY88_08045 [SAR202 cluster bacterium Io17-Chloro-G9]